MGLLVALETDRAGARFGEVVKAAEEVGVAFVTFADSPLPPAGGFRLEAVGRAAFLATRTSGVGLAPGVPTATTEPFHLAAQIASLDHATHGRAGWVVQRSTAAELATVGGGDGESPAEVVRVVRALWDSWEDDAVVKDVATGRYLDPDRVHHVDFVGTAFTVKGPLITPRPPQGQPVVIAPADLGVDADVVLVDEPVDRDGPLVFLELAVTPDLPAVLRDLDGRVDGVRLHPAEDDFGTLFADVLPALDLPPRGATLRATLGLTRPANRFATGGVR
ncbi:LLM class flavin-dependent oxidoreductase [Actinosynnema sp. NPDC020468]|uniref:LLM class flavin-dependent oxidoreductase n=1 Tax=Actinosynnema sp. NPDC020468 TaxID=3154488 RepID=UPI003406B20B